jgi:hypothetical protein
VLSVSFDPLPTGPVGEKKPARGPSSKGAAAKPPAAKRDRS